MFGVGVVLDILKSIYAKIGITGIIIIIMAGGLGWQHLSISHKNSEITTLTAQVKDLQDKIAIQNKAVEDEKAAKAAAQKLLDEAAKKNADLDKKNKALQDALKKKPIATTCTGAIDEVKQSAKDFATEWNKK